ncbi:hypothetical protein [Actinomarinicola tropica]|uniref:Transmembrane protein n=1 Tax=Actinomarinicola tropica TaxID=2789776 RepID=A0A5Q2RQC0_9ACTN|nr:hypothetical protein [Actinomarinicola tropica]QGG96090.1 hypothetical protein GH723_13835 [Actinomarinicola tropica]
MLKVGLAVGLVVAWASVLLPPIARLLGGVGRPSDSVGSFRQKMSVLGGGMGRARSGGPALDLTSRLSAPAASMRTGVRRTSTARQRRRQVLVGLLASTGLTALAGLVVGGIAWALFAVSVLLLAAYVAMLWQMQQVALERRHKVAYLPRQEDHAEAPALHRVGAARG